MTRTPLRLPLRPQYTARVRNAMSCYSSQFEFQGRTYKCLASDEQVKVFLDRLEDWRNRNASSLFSFREDLRRIVRHRPIRGLVWCSIHRGTPTRNIAIWLLGQIRHRSVMCAVASFQCDTSHGVRKEVAKALRRMGAWKQLRELANDTHPAVKRIAIERSAKPFHQRLDRFLHDDVRSSAVNTHRQRVKFSLQHQQFSGCPPKSGLYIRQVLMRIRFLVRHQRRHVFFGWPQWLQNCRNRRPKPTLHQRNEL